MINTLILKAYDIDKDFNNIKIAAEILKNSGLVAIPTETVYGLAANAFNDFAVSKIFKAKGRPQDNPLIVHIADISALSDLVTVTPPKAKLLADEFWPGPLTMIFKKKENICRTVSAGLDTIAIRMPNNKIATEIIKASGLPLAAPSANLSGSPSPTKSKHVVSDLFGKIDAIIESDECNIGVESTVISMVSDLPKLLRPGGITKKQIESVIGPIDVDKSITSKISDNESVSSPGMKYKHYSPKAQVIIVEGTLDKFNQFIKERYKEGIYALCFDDDEVSVPHVSFGKSNDDNMQAKRVFSALRELDEVGAQQVYARCPSKHGVGLAVYNRLLRAADFEVIKL